MLSWNTKRLVATAMLVAVATVSCAKKAAEDEDRSITPLGAEEVLKLPGEADAGTLNLLEAPAGTYSVVKIQTYRLNDNNKTRALFIHDVKAPGAPAKGDGYRMKVDWAKIDKAKVTGYVYLELNLPNQIVASGTAVEFKDVHKYTNSVSSDDSWGWTISGGISASGVRFHDTFSAGTRSNKTFDAPNLTTSDVGKGIATLFGGDLTIFVEMKAAHGDLVVVAVTYRK